MSLVLIEPPLLEPVTLAEAKAHLRIDLADEDVVIQSLILTSRLHVEAALGLALVQQRWSYFIDAWPRTEIVTLPLRPVQSLDAIRLHAADGGVTTLTSADVGTLDSDVRDSRFVLDTMPPSPGRKASGIELMFTAGFGAVAADVPAPIRHALLLLVAHWYEHRDPGEIGTEKTRIPAAVSDLLMPYKPVRL